MEELLLKEYTDEKLEEILIDSTIKYYTILESEKEAKSVLKEYKQEYFDVHQEFKKHYFTLREYARSRNIIMPFNSMNFEITMEDVIERLRESEAGYIALIYRHADNYYGYLGCGVFEKDNNTSLDENVGANIRAKEIEDIYEEIINNYENRKSNVK